MSKSFEEIFKESNPNGFKGYDGPCKCCPPSTPEKVTKAYNRGRQEAMDSVLDNLVNNSGVTISVTLDDLRSDSYYRGIEAGAKVERERILRILDHNADTVAVNWLIHLINKDTK